MTYDSKSYELAMHFLADAKISDMEMPSLAHALAQVIQKSVEDWLSENVIYRAQEDNDG